MISVVMPALNARSTIGDQLRAILDQATGLDMEVVVADNGSVDGTAELVADLAAEDHRLRLVDASQRPRGGAAAKNLGVHVARGEVVAFADADDLVGPGWLAAAHAALQDHDVVRFQPEYRLLNPDIPLHELPRPIGNPVFMGVPVVAGGLFGIRRDLYLRLGGFDEQMGGSVDTEFGIRLFKETLEPAFVASDAITHVRLPVRELDRLRRSKAFAASRGIIIDRHRDLLRSSPHPILATGKGWALLLRDLPQTVKPTTRHRWKRRLYSRIGLIEGWRRHGVLVA